jgi:WD40 repeat protein
VTRLVASPHGDWLAAGATDGTAHIWDPVTGHHHCELTGHDNWLGPPVPAPGGSWLATGGGDFAVRIWDPIAGVCHRVLAHHNGWINAIAVAPDGSWLVSATGTAPCPSGTCHPGNAGTSCSAIRHRSAR